MITQDIKHAAAGQWRDILSRLGGLSVELLDGKHHPCPKCGGKDRFRMLNAEAGSLFCNQCFDRQNGDGLAALQWLNGWDFGTTCDQLAEFLHLRNGRGNGRSFDIVERVAGIKRMPLESFRAYGAVPAIRNDKPAARVPSYGPDGKQCSHFDLFADNSKGKAARGKGVGVFLPHDDEGKPILPARGETWCVVEGVKDAAALLGQGHQAVGLNSCRLAKKFATLFTGVHVLLVPDRDRPSVEGFAKAARLLDGRAASIATVHLPAEMKATGGDDVRDILAQKDGADLLAQAIESAEPYGGPDDDLGDDAGDDEGDGHDQQTKQSIATVLVNMATALCAEFWHCDQTPYATFVVNDHTEHHPIRTRAFKSWLAHAYYQRFERTPGSQAVQDALSVLEGRAIHAGRERAVHIRTAEHEGSYYIDLGTPEWSAVEVSPGGWKIVQNPPVVFRRPKAMSPLPIPVVAGADGVERLRNYVNCDDDAWPLVLSWLVAALRPHGPYPVLCLSGEQGSGKSTVAELLRTLVDPNVAPIRAEPKDNRDLMLAANNGHVVALDNLSRIDVQLSDALCRLSTGGGFSTRTLYTDDEETIFSATRPIILTGITEVATRGDLIDRSLAVALPRIESRQTEKELWRAFEADAPAILGALLSAMSHGLASVDSVTGDWPRMADFARWAVACEPSFGRDDFMDAFNASRRTANDVAIEASPVAVAILEMDLDAGFEGTASELLEYLKAVAWDLAREMSGDGGITWAAARPDGWPKSPRKLAGDLRRLAPCLREAGVAVEFTRDTSASRRRLVNITREEQ